MPIPSISGIGLRGAHIVEVVAERPKVGWLEIHSENYMDSSLARGVLADLRRDYPISFHAVGLSLGGVEPVDTDFLARLRSLCLEIEPELVSDHLSWCRHDGAFYNDLLPIPYTAEALSVICRNIDQVQSVLRRRILIENPSRYLSYVSNEMTEVAFLSEISRITGCGILCDVNNIYVSCTNTGGDPVAYLASLPGDAIGEYHLAGHTVDAVDPPLLVDTHAEPVAAAVWDLFGAAVALHGPRPTLIEWDDALPSFDVLQEEARKADAYIASARNGALHDIAV